MLRSMQEIAFSMKMHSDKMNVISNNISNANTRAYKKERLNSTSFGDVMIQAMKHNDANSKKINIGSMVLGVQAGKPRTVFEQGHLEETDVKTDVAIRGDGFFTVETPNGRLYTRAGNFRINEEGYLVTQEGFNVLGENGRINLNNRIFSIDLKGNIINQDVYIDKLLLVKFDKQEELEKMGAGYYSSTNPILVEDSDRTDVLHKFLEGSNVNMVEETRDMMIAKNGFESGQQLIKMLDETLNKAVNEIGKM